MHSFDLVHQRLANQRLSTAPFQHPAEVVDWLGAVQAQDFAGAKWALGLRIQRAADSDIEKAFNAGEILRTHILRPTWHFVSPVDIRWMLALTAPRVHMRNAHMYRKAGLDSALFKRSHAVLLKVLQGGVQLTRDELRGVFQKAGIGTEGEFRMNYLLMHAELEGLICSGPRRGRQFTYALLDERAPQGVVYPQDEALARLARLYFLSRGPATVQDFAKWSGLTIADAARGLEAVKDGLEQQDLEGKPHWYPPQTGPFQEIYPRAYLLSIYDEFISSYKGLNHAASPEHASRLVELGNNLAYIILIDGRIAGNWKRKYLKDTVLIALNLFRSLSQAEEQALTSAVYKYGEFYGLPVVVEEVSS